MKEDKNKEEDVPRETNSSHANLILLLSLAQYG